MFVKRITVGSVWRIHISAPQFRVTRDQSMYPPADRTCVLSAAKRSTVLSQHQSAPGPSSSSTTSHIKNDLKKKTDLQTSAAGGVKTLWRFTFSLCLVGPSASWYWFKFGITIRLAQSYVKQAFSLLNWNVSEYTQPHPMYEACLRKMAIILRRQLIVYN